MLPGFITLFKDNDGFIHLYFFQGLTDNMTPYYNKLDFTNNSKYKYKMIMNPDNSTEYIFENKKIKSMICNLVTYNGSTSNIQLNI